MNTLRILDISGRVLYALPMFVFGFGHLKDAGSMAGMVPAWVPGGVLWVYLTGLALIAAAVSIVWGKLAREAAIALAALMLVFVLTVHLPGLGATDPMMKMIAFLSVLKDTALAGGALVIAAQAKSARQ